MILERVHVERLPGIDEPFEVDCAPGLNVVVGSNAAGKTSLARGVLDTLLGAREFRGDLTLVARRDGRRTEVRRRSGEPARWIEGEPPSLPEERFRHAFHLELADLLARRGAESVAEKIREELDRGLDLDAPLREERVLGGRTQEAARLADELRARGRAVRDVERRHAELDERRQSLAELEARRVAARAALGEQPLLSRAVELARDRAELAAVDSERASFSAGMNLLRDGDGRELEDLRAALLAAEDELAAAHVRLEAAVAEIGAADHAENVPDEEELRGLSALVEAARAAEARAAEAARARARAEALLREAASAIGEAAGSSPVPIEVVAALEERIAARSAHTSELAAVRARLAELEARAGSSEAESGRSRSPWLALAAAITLVAIGALALSGAAALALVVPGALLAGIALALLAQRRGKTRLPAALDAARTDLARCMCASEERAAEQERWLAGAGLDPGLGALAALEVDRRLRAHASARAAAVDASAEETVLSDELDARLRDLSARLGAGSVESSADASTCVERLRGLRRALEDAHRALARAEEDAARASEGRERAEARLRRFTAARGLEGGADEELTRRLERLADWSALEMRGQRAEAGVAACETALAARADLLALDEAAAAELLRACGERAAELDELTREIAEVESALAAALRDGDLTAALAAEDAEEAALFDLRERALTGRAASFLLDGVRAEHRRAVRSGIVPRARELFGRFTRGEYDLDVDGGDGGPELGILARDTAGRALGVHQLSGGTRVQLLLALQIAVAEHVERGESLPLFVDEALASTDPERGRVVARAIAELCAEGRQVFALTASVEEQRRFLEGAQAVEGCVVHRIDLDDLRRGAAAIPSPDALRVAPHAQIPAQGGLSQEEYLVQLGVPRVDPFAPADAVHVAHLYRDDLARLRALLAEGLERLGRLRRCVGQPGLAHLGDLTDDVEARGAVAEAFLDLWRIGRTRPATREELREILGKTVYADAVLALADELDGDGPRLVTALEEGRSPSGWGTGRTQRLRDELERSGLWTGAAPLPPDELFERACARCGALLAEARLTRTRVRELCAWLAAGVGDGSLRQRPSASTSQP